MTFPLSFVLGNAQRDHSEAFQNKSSIANVSVLKCLRHYDLWFGFTCILFQNWEYDSPSFSCIYRKRSATSFTADFLKSAKVLNKWVRISHMRHVVASALCQSMFAACVFVFQRSLVPWKVWRLPVSFSHHSRERWRRSTQSWQRTLAWWTKPVTLKVGNLPALWWFL